MMNDWREGELRTCKREDGDSEGGNRQLFSEGKSESLLEVWGGVGCKVK